MTTLIAGCGKWNGRKRPHDRRPAAQPVEQAPRPLRASQTPKAGPFSDPARVTELAVLLGCYGIGIELR